MDLDSGLAVSAFESDLVPLESLPASCFEVPHDRRNPALIATVLDMIRGGMSPEMLIECYQLDLTEEEVAGAIAGRASVHVAAE